MDKLEKYIRDNRSDLDRYQPGPGVWQSIIKNRPDNFLILKKIAGWAAAVALLLVSTIIVFSTINQGSLLMGRSEQSKAELVETESYYTNKVNSLMEKAAPLLVTYPDLKEDLLTEIADLDKIYSDIKKDLKDNVSNEEVMEALIRNYLVKIQILEEMLKMLNDGEENNEKVTGYEI